MTDKPLHEKRISELLAENDCAGSDFIMYKYLKQWAIAKANNLYDNIKNCPKGCIKTGHTLCQSCLCNAAIRDSTITDYEIMEEYLK